MPYELGKKPQRAIQDPGCFSHSALPSLHVFHPCCLKLVALLPASQKSFEQEEEGNVKKEGTAHIKKAKLSEILSTLKLILIGQNWVT